MAAAVSPYYLNGVESAVAVERESDDVGGVLVPASVHRVAHDVSCLGEDLLDEDLLPAESNSLPEVGGHAHHQTLAGLSRAPLITLLLPALQLLQHGGELVVPSLLIQQVKVLQRQGERGEQTGNKINK